MTTRTPIVIRHCTGNTSAWGAFIDNANLWCMGTARRLHSGQPT